MFRRTKRICQLSIFLVDVLFLFRIFMSFLDSSLFVLRISAILIIFLGCKAHLHSRKKCLLILSCRPSVHIEL